MYYTAFFPDFRPSVRICLAKFLKDNFDNTWINNSGRTERFTPDMSLPDLDDDPNLWCDVGEVKPWCIHGEQQDNCLLDFPSAGKSSLNEISTLYEQISQNYSWCLIPWGSAGSFFGFAFISPNKNLRDEFINIVDDLEPIGKHNPKPKCTNKYDIDSNLENFIQCILFDIDSNFLGMRIWEFTRLTDSFPPLIIMHHSAYPSRKNISNYTMYFNDNRKEFMPFGNGLDEKFIMNMKEYVKADNAYFWDNFDEDFDEIYQEKCYEVGQLACLDEFGEKCNVFGVEQWGDQRFFNQICKFYSKCEFMIILPLPKYNDFQVFQNVLSIIRSSKYGLSDDVLMMPELLHQVDWFIGIDRPLEHGESNCIFMSRNNCNIHTFINIEYPDDFSLISCF
jgi:hypothetical protein